VAVATGRNVVLIAGGADKALDTETLTTAIFALCKQVVLTPGSGTEKLLAALEAQDLSELVIVVENLSFAVEEAKLAAEPGDVILFSPAFASFAQYKNEYERNDEFMSLITPKADDDWETEDE
jgi:UDP-N-acetylmuramoylalanine--D-glutamate ligase